MSLSVGISTPASKNDTLKNFVSERKNFSTKTLEILPFFPPQGSGFTLNPQSVSIHLQPYSTFLEVRNDTLNMLPILCSVIVFQEMTEFMDDYVIHNVMRRDDDPPIVSDITTG